MTALRAHASQTSGLIELIGTEVYRDWVAGEWFVTADDHPDFGFER